MPYRHGNPGARPWRCVGVPTLPLHVKFRRTIAVPGHTVRPVMANPDQKSEDASLPDETAGVVVIRVAGHAFALPADATRSLDTVAVIHPVPQAPPGISGLAELNGRISTVVDLRRRLGFSPRTEEGPAPAVTLDIDGFLYTLMVDEIGDVVSLPSHLATSDGPKSEELWAFFIAGSFSLGGGKFLPVLDIEALVQFEHERDAD